MEIQEIKSSINDLVEDTAFSLQVSQVSSQLSIIINRLGDKASKDYVDIADLIQARLTEISLPDDIKSVKYYGRKQGIPKPEWQTSRTLGTKSIKPTVTRSRSESNVLSKLQNINSTVSIVKDVASVVSAAALIGIFAILLINAFAGQKTQPQSLVWEYRIESINDIIFEETMNQRGEEGWELAFARRARNSLTDEFSYECIFKRSVKQD